MDVDAVWRKKAPQYTGPVTVFSVDHILTQNSRDFFRNAGEGRGQRRSAPTKTVVLDAGSSVFASSGSWLSCAYAQAGLFPDHLIAWERDYVEPKHYWSQVPPPFKPRVTFNNVAVVVESPTGGASSPSPLRFIRERTTPDDFVAFKLDIDSPKIEIGIAQQLQADSAFHDLVDEFFFELHFNCEFHESCWGKDVATTVAGQNLDRHSAMMLFYDLRKVGIRAHFWP